MAGGKSFVTKMGKSGLLFEAPVADASMCPYGK
jgi:hypothetical protein